LWEAFFTNKFIVTFWLGSVGDLTGVSRDSYIIKACIPGINLLGGVDFQVKAQAPSYFAQAWLDGRVQKVLFDSQSRIPVSFRASPEMAIRI